MDILHKIRRDRKDDPIGVDPNLGISHFLLLRLQIMPYLLRQLPDYPSPASPASHSGKKADNKGRIVSLA